MADDSDIDSSWYLKRDEYVKPVNKNDNQSNYQDAGIYGFKNFQKSFNNYSDDNKEESSRSSVPEVRFINPAIYAESFTPSNVYRENVKNGYPSTDEEEATSVVVEVRCGDTNDLTKQLSNLSVNEKSPSIGHGDAAAPAADTYRCNQSDTSRSSSLTLTNNSKSVTRLIRRCAIDGQSSKIYDDCGELEDEDVRRYSINGRRVVQFSSTSLQSSSTFSDKKPSQGLALARKIAHEEWVQKKQRAAQVKTETERREDLRRQAEQDRIEKERLEREWKERDNFLRWQERKKKEETDRKLALERELDLQRRLKAVENQASIAKIIHLQQWAKKKEDAQKAQQKEQELKRRAIEEERKKRLEESSQAFKKWRENAKGRPRPATQGLLPHQRAKPSFVNPKPWQKIADDDEDNEAGESNERNNFTGKKIICDTKNDGRKIIASHQ